MNAPIIYRLTITAFRGIKNLEWHPQPGMNIILGGGDVGKTTVLDAISLLLSPTNPATLSDAEYHLRDLKGGFSIEAVIHLPPDTLINQQTRPSWPWEWNGNAPMVPTIGDGSAPGAPAYVLRVRGTPDLELIYEIVQPSGDTDHFSVGLRRAIGQVRLSGDDRNDRDLRLVQGSALDRLLSDKALRSRLGSKLSQNDIRESLDDEAKKTLVALDAAFTKSKLPDKLDLSITGAQGITITALIGLTADRNGVRLPLANWGAGTRRLAALAIAEHDQDACPITLVDEAERGLEPYRQRQLIAKLQSSPSQVFLTTHSTAVVSAATSAAMWYLDSKGSIGLVDRAKIGAHQKYQPDIFLSRLAIVAEGAAEVGFVRALLEKALGTAADDHGFYVSDAGGHESALSLLQTFSDAGLSFGGFIDDEGKHSGTLDKLSKALGPLLFKWKMGCLEHNVINALDESQFEAFITDPSGHTGDRLRTLADRLDIEAKDLVAIKMAAGDLLRQRMIEAATSFVPPEKKDKSKEFRKHGQRWFKTVDGGRELLAKVLTLGLWPKLRDELLPFINAVRKEAGLPELADLP
jgi:putative ATP-dependent endonuclease of OLD family